MTPGSQGCDSKTDDTSSSDELMQLAISLKAQNNCLDTFLWRTFGLNVTSGLARPNLTCLIWPGIETLHCMGYRGPHVI